LIYPFWRLVSKIRGVKKRITSIILLLGFLLLGGCNGGDDGEVDESLWTATPSLTPSPTITIQWFPPTATLEPAHTMVVEPTADMRPGLGRSLLEDSFEESPHWNVASAAAGSVAFGGNELTLAIKAPKESLITLRDGPSFDNFYLEITTQASLCRGNDYYGIVFRALGPQNFYRYSVSCNGTIRVDRVKGGYATILWNWSPSGQVPPGSPITLRLGVWAMGREMRFFINDAYQFAVRDAVFQFGRVGLFARSTGTSAVSISFSNLAVNSLNDDAAASISTLVPPPSLTPTRTKMRRTATPRPTLTPRTKK
jgi:hypothetical protein